MQKIKIKNLIKDIEIKIEDKTLEIFKSALSSFIVESAALAK